MKIGRHADRLAVDLCTNVGHEYNKHPHYQRLSDPLNRQKQPNFNAGQADRQKNPCAPRARSELAINSEYLRCSTSPAPNIAPSLAGAHVHLEDVIVRRPPDGSSVRLSFTSPTLSSLMYASDRCRYFSTRQCIGSCLIRRRSGCTARRSDRLVGR
jgi:hypothetical protein